MKFIAFDRLLDLLDVIVLFHYFTCSFLSIYSLLQNYFQFCIKSIAVLVSFVTITLITIKPRPDGASFRATWDFLRLFSMLHGFIFDWPSASGLNQRKATRFVYLMLYVDVF